MGPLNGAVVGFAPGVAAGARPDGFVVFVELGHFNVVVPRGDAVVFHCDKEKYRSV